MTHPVYAEPMDGKIHVHVDNLGDIQPTIRTEEKEPEHFVASTKVLTAASTQSAVGQGTTRNDIDQVLDNDPLRKGATILSIDNPIVVCTSYQQAANTANQVATVPFPQGFYLPTGGSVSIDGTGPLWVVNTNPAVNARVSVLINRRGSA